MPAGCAAQAGQHRRPGGRVPHRTPGTPTGPGQRNFSCVISTPSRRAACRSVSDCALPHGTDVRGHELDVVLIRPFFDRLHERRDAPVLGLRPARRLRYGSHRKGTAGKAHPRVDQPAVKVTRKHLANPARAHLGAISQLDNLVIPARDQLVECGHRAHEPSAAAHRTSVYAGGLEVSRQCWCARRGARESGRRSRSALCPALASPGLGDALRDRAHACALAKYL